MYPPFFLFTTISFKLLEQIVHSRLLDHRLSDSLLSDKQFGFWPGRFTQEAIIYATVNWNKHIDKGDNVATIFLNF